LSGHTFFFYGSLMDRDLLEAVIGRRASGIAFTPGWLTGYTAEKAAGYTFPTLVESRTGRVNGVITQGLTQADADRITYYEDNDEYAAQIIDIATAETDIAAQVFMSATPMMSSGEPWSFDRWKKHDKPLLLAITRKVMTEHYGITPANKVHDVWMRIKAELEAMMNAPVQLKPKRATQTPAAKQAAPRRATPAASPTRRPRGS
jgi:hypothetical protein